MNADNKRGMCCLNICRYAVIAVAMVCSGITMPIKLLNVDNGSVAIGPPPDTMLVLTPALPALMTHDIDTLLMPCVAVCVILPGVQLSQNEQEACSFLGISRCAI